MTELRPFRFGLNAVNTVSPAAWRDTARKAEALGYSTLVVADHIWTPLALLASLVVAAEATTTLRIGGFVFGNDFWHPAVLAREAATIDVFSGGRLELGLGTGWERADYEQRGIPLDPPSVRVRRFEEAIQVVKRLFADTPATFSGEFYTIDNLTSLPKPVQRPHPPILIGGGGRRMLSLAVREADIVSVNLKTTAAGELEGSSFTAQATDRKVEWIRQAAGAQFDALELNNLVLAVRITGDREGAAAQLVTDWQPSLSREQVLGSPYFLFGTVDKIVEDLEARRERYGISYITLFGEEYMEAFAPIVARLGGT